MRSRNLKPGFFKNEELAELDPLARILFEGLWCFSDREGLFEWRPKKIKVEILPYDNCDIDRLLMSLHEKTLICLIEKSGKKYGWVKNFKVHQNPHPHEARSKILPVIGNIENAVKCNDNKCNVLLIPDTRIPFSLIPSINSASENAVEKKGKKREGKKDDEEFLITKKKKKIKGKRLETFLLFWDAFNWKKGRAEAMDSWLDIPELTESLVNKIITAAKSEAKNRATLISKGRTPKWAQGWLTARRWEDEALFEESETQSYPYGRN